MAANCGDHSEFEIQNIQNCFIEILFWSIEIDSVIGKVQNSS